MYVAVSRVHFKLQVAMCVYFALQNAPEKVGKVSPGLNIFHKKMIFIAELTSIQLMICQSVHLFYKIFMIEFIKATSREKRLKLQLKLLHNHWMKET